MGTGYLNLEISAAAIRQNPADRHLESPYLADRPLHYRKRYHFSLGQNLNSARESFGLHGNAGFKEFSVYGNNRKFSKRQIVETRFNGMAVLCEKDHEVFSTVTATFKPKLLAILRKHRSYSETAYKKTGYADEISYEEFFVWWYHFIYTKATGILAPQITALAFFRPRIGLDGGQ